MTIREDQAAPEFAIAMRGYDRLQVDEYVSQLNSWVAEAETRQSIAEGFVTDRDRHIELLQQRIRELESERGERAAGAALDDVSQRIATALEGALKSCNELQANTQTRCQEVLEGARRDAQAVVSAAHATIADLEEVAKAQAQSIIDDADRYRTSARSEVERLREEHQRVLDQLTQLRGSLEGLISAPAAVLAAVDDITGHRADAASSNGRAEKASSNGRSASAAE